MKTLVLANQKGGVGKSAIATQFAFFMAHRGKRVLHVDLDHQGNSSTAIIKSGLAKVAAYSASEVLAGGVTALPDAAFVVIAGDTVLSTLERQPCRHNAFVASLRDFLHAVAGHFDVCVIDTNPNPDIRYAAALIVADFLLSPVELNQEALDGILALLDHPRYGMYKIKRVMNPELRFIGLLPNLVEATPFQRANLAQLVTSYARFLIALPGGSHRYAFVPARTAIAEAQACGSPLWQLRYAVSSPEEGAIDPKTMPLRTAAREAWREVRPVFDEIERQMEMGS